jgi:Ni2+-binding GTPase involved in maturation of urease and hydrogenase
VTEGDDKPAKYPHVFRASSLLVLNKIDLLPYVPFDTGRCLQFASRANPVLQVVSLSVTRGDGLADWYACAARAGRVVRPSLTAGRAFCDRLPGRPGGPPCLPTW